MRVCCSKVPMCMSRSTNNICKSQQPRTKPGFQTHCRNKHKLRTTVALPIIICLGFSSQSAREASKFKL